MAQTLDTAFLLAQDPDQHASLAIGAVAIIDGPAPEHDLLTKQLAKRIRSIPRCTQVLRSHPLRQQWIDYPEFDLTHHLRRVAIAGPGGEAELARAIAHACERPLDLDRPPWECWVIEGLKGNRWAILMKTHHCLLDGNPPAHLLTRLCDDADSDIFANYAEAKQVPEPQPPRPGWAEPLQKAAALAGNLVGGLLPASPTDRVSTLRRYATVRVPIAEVDAVCRKFGVTANDVALAAITEGFRTVLLHRGEEPRADSLRTLVPLFGQAVSSAMLPYLPVEHDDPVQRLRTVHTRWKSGLLTHPQSSGVVESAINFLPTMLRSSIIQALARLPRRGIVALTTNAQGPRHRLRLMGQTMERLLPIPPTAEQLSTGVAVLSYGDELVFGLTADHGAEFDVKQLAAGIELGMARLAALSQASVLLFSRDRRRGRSPRAFPGRTPPWHPSSPGQARH